MDIISINLAARNALRKLGVDVEPGKLILDRNLSKNDSFPNVTVFGEDVEGNELVVGKGYTVTTDSGVFTSVCKTDGLYIYLGNMKFFGGEDTGESFVACMAKESVWFFLALDYASGSHMKIVSEETIHPIDQKYLPGVCLPVVELTTEPTADGVELTAEESAKMDAVAENIMPFIVKFVVDGLVVAVMVSAVGIPGSPPAYGANAPMDGANCIVSLYKSIGWVFSASFTE